MGRVARLAVDRPVCRLADAGRMDHLERTRVQLVTDVVMNPTDGEDNLGKPLNVIPAFDPNCNVEAP
jgi:hypothetical protein